MRNNKNSRRKYGGKLHDIVISNDFLNTTSKAQARKNGNLWLASEGEKRKTPKYMQ